MPRSPVVLADQPFAWPQPPRDRAHHEQREFGRRVRKYIGRNGKWDLVTIGPGAIDVVEPDSDLRDHFQSSFSRPKYFFIDLVTQRCDQTVDAGTCLFDDQ